ncbi:hypothetical protein ACHAXT_007777 [Thalassiosira profunda]
MSKALFEASPSVKPLPPILELCEDCRLNGASGRPFTCLDRAIFLMARYKLSEEKARESVMAANGNNCNMTRFPVEMWSPEMETMDPCGTSGGANGGSSIFSAGGNISVDAAHASNKATNAASISIYFYETLPTELGIGLERNATSQYATGSIAEENFKADVAIIQLFRTYPGRVLDPTKADLFVVPYPHAAHCLLHLGYYRACMHVPSETIERGVLDNLEHYQGNELRHLFINTHEVFHTNTLMKQPLFLTLGPRLSDDVSAGKEWALGSVSSLAGQIVVPYLNDQRAFQPSAILSRSKEWWVRPRKYSLVYFFGSSTNKNMRGNSPRYYRTYFIEEVQRNWNTTRLLGGLPYVVKSMKQLNVNFASANRQFFGKMYGMAQFCLVLPGDSPSQKRFFDAILSGCIPVVLSFESSMAGLAGRSWHIPDGHPVYDVYPWATGSNSTYKHFEIDYPSFVVEVYGGVGNIKSAIESVVANQTDVRRRQLQLMRYAPAFAYGVGTDAHAHDNDAFARIIGSLRYYLSGLDNNRQG